MRGCFPVDKGVVGAPLGRRQELGRQGKQWGHVVLVRRNF